MTKIASALASSAILLGLHLFAAPAQAQLSRTYVSASGNDANNCDRATPCRTFQGAHDKTNPDGEVTVLDPGGYGGLTITKSISIVNDGVGEASILVSGGATGITINAGAASYVNLRGITIQGIGFGGGSGLRFKSGFALTITNCVIRNHTGDGIFFLPTTNSNLAVSNTLVSDNGSNGIVVQPGAAGVVVNAVFDRVEIYNNSGDGLFAVASFPSSSVTATVTESVAANNHVIGFSALSALSTGAFPVLLLVVRSVAANNHTGIAAEGADAHSTALVEVGQSVMTGNQISWSRGTNGGLASFGDNYIIGNQDGDPAPGTLPQR